MSFFETDKNGNVPASEIAEIYRWMAEMTDRVYRLEEACRISPGDLIKSNKSVTPKDAIKALCDYVGVYLEEVIPDKAKVRAVEKRL